ncbi:MAG: DUF4174 domain-containing protein [Desulfosarcinaceae bacterium]|nr:DUF4174 domain-containing protein [Desulfosarcinaceae bacterium]
MPAQRVGIAFICLTLMVPASTAATSDLSPYRWQQRLLLVFAATPSDAAYQELERQLHQQRTAVQDRDLLVFRIFAVGTAQGPDSPMSDEDADLLRRRYGVPADQFQIVLIGKDGGDKGRYGSPPALQAIFDRIDTMPMRQEEMRRRDGGA